MAMQFEEAAAHWQAPNEIDRLVGLFGGARALNQRITSTMEAHDLILRGIPSQAVENLVTHLKVIDASDVFDAAFGMSERTFQRQKADKTRSLSSEQSSRTWNFVRILDRASGVFGSQEEAERWLLREAIGLDGRRPIDLLATHAGTELVLTYLDRMDYGVYA